MSYLSPHKKFSQPALKGGKDVKQNCRDGENRNGWNLCFTAQVSGRGCYERCKKQLVQPRIFYWLVCQARIWRRIAAFASRHVSAG